MGLESTATITNDDEAGFLVTSSGDSVSVSEAGASELVSVVLTAAPLSDVIIIIEVDDVSEVAVDQETLTFTPGNWNVPQSVEITGVDDVSVDGTVDSLVSFSILTSESDAAFSGLDDQAVLVKTDR